MGKEGNYFTGEGGGGIEADPLKCSFFFLFFFFCPTDRPTIRRDGVMGNETFLLGWPCQDIILRLSTLCNLTNGRKGKYCSMLSFYLSNHTLMVKTTTSKVISAIICLLSIVFTETLLLLNFSGPKFHDLGKKFSKC